MKSEPYSKFLRYLPPVLGSCMLASCTVIDIIGPTSKSQAQRDQDESFCDKRTAMYSGRLYGVISCLNNLGDTVRMSDGRVYAPSPPPAPPPTPAPPISVGANNAGPGDTTPSNKKKMSEALDGLGNTPGEMVIKIFFCQGVLGMRSLTANSDHPIYSDDPKAVADCWKLMKSVGSQ